jgi:hypothetical protein
MSNIVKWQDSTVDVRAWLVPRFLWSTASVEVFLDGQCILRTGGQMKFTGSYSTTFSHSGSTHTAELRWGMMLFSLPYQLRIDGVSIADSRVRVKNWLLGMIAWALVGAIFAAVILHFIHMSRA